MRPTVRNGLRACPAEAVRADHAKFSKEKGAPSGNRRAIPDTRGGVIFRRILTVVLVGSIIGIADQLRTLFWIVLTGEGPNPIRILIMLFGWVILCWCG